MAVSPTSFVDLMALEKVGKDAEKYISRVPAYNPGNGTAFGGHVYAQAAWAASLSVDEGMLIHVSFSVPQP